MVTWRSCMASSSADCVLGGVRLISSAISTWVNSGPRTRRKARDAGSKTLVPMTSVGIRSGVNWMRAKRTPSAAAKARASSVLPMPGTPLEQHVPAGHVAGQQPLDRRALAEHHARPARPPCRPPRDRSASRSSGPPRCALAGHRLGERQTDSAAPRHRAAGVPRVQLVRARHQQRRRLAVVAEPVVQRAQAAQERSPRIRCAPAGRTRRARSGRASASSASRYTTARCTSHRSNTRRLPVVVGDRRGREAVMVLVEGPGPPEGLRAASPAGPRPRVSPGRALASSAAGRTTTAAAQALVRERERATLRVCQQRRGLGRRLEPMRERAHADRGGLVLDPGARRSHSVRANARHAKGPRGGRGRSSIAFRPRASAARASPAGWARLPEYAKTTAPPACRWRVSSGRTSVGSQRCQGNTSTSTRGAPRASSSGRSISSTGRAARFHVEPRRRPSGRAARLGAAGATGPALSGDEDGEADATGHQDRESDALTFLHTAASSAETRPRTSSCPGGRGP